MENCWANGREGSVEAYGSIKTSGRKTYTPSSVTRVARAVRATHTAFGALVRSVWNRPCIGVGFRWISSCSPALALTCAWPAAFANRNARLCFLFKDCDAILSRKVLFALCQQHEVQAFAVFP